MTKKPSYHLVLAIAIIALVIACNSEPKLQNTQIEQQRSLERENGLQIWWDKGYIAEEDEILQQIVDNWQQKSGEKAKLSFYVADEIAQKTQRAIKAGNPPDVLFSSRAEYPLLALQGELADVSDVIEPVEQSYTDTARKSAYLYNNVEKKYSYYSVPLHQATIHIFYWRDLLERVEKKPDDIPLEWNEFWDFWRDVHTSIYQKQPEIYGLGMPFSIEASDTYYLFEQILEAYNVQILDDSGNLAIDNPKVREGIINCLQWYADFYLQDYVPSDAINWLDPDNNRNFLNHNVVMTPNPTLSIATALRSDKKTYLNKLGTMEFPHKPDGDRLKHLVSVRQAAILNTAKNRELAKDFLSYLIQPEVINNYLKSAGGRYLPAIIPAIQDSFWTNPQDLHISTATKTLTKGQTRLFYSVQNPIYSSVLEENVWGLALNRIIVDGVSPEQAADEAIARIETIFSEWK
ncbi:ABC transporter substrate-binding protein [Myxosarcina sp. GI1]|uniref:ABC transporter substrate-binding protein n=1 Tax=Myxosarcina sp. GI1 TaxID=1541065 RepID=UPI00055C3B45|nr:ABC transporter substrate-binding protein [Myxosarcina sp. GI1]